MKRRYSVIELLKFHYFANNNDDLKPMELIEQFNAKHPELSEKQKIHNLMTALNLSHCKSDNCYGFAQDTENNKKYCVKCFHKLNTEK